MMIKFFSQFPELTAVMSEKEDGSMKILLENEIVWRQNQENRELFFQKIGIDGGSVVSADLVHSNNVEIIENAQTKIISKTDGFVSCQRGIFLTITVADCIPVFLYEKEKGIVALAHAGWKGVLEDILGETVEKILGLGGEPGNIYVSFGPGIDRCHFEIKEDVVEKFSNYSEFIIRENGRTFADLKGIMEKQLLTLGVRKENIENYAVCTYESERMFSYRRDKPMVTEAMIAGIVFRES